MGERRLFLQEIQSFKASTETDGVIDTIGEAAYVKEPVGEAHEYTIDFF